MDCSLPGSSIHGILQARILEWVVISFCRESFRPKDQTRVFCITGRLFTNWAAGEALVPGKLYPKLKKALLSFLAFQSFLPESADAQGKKVAPRLHLTPGFPLLSDFGLVILQCLFSSLVVWKIFVCVCILNCGKLCITELNISVTFNSVILSRIALCSHHHHSCPEPSSFHGSETLYPLSNTFLFCPPLSSRQTPSYFLFLWIWVF